MKGIFRSYSFFQSVCPFVCKFCEIHFFVKLNNGTPHMTNYGAQVNRKWPGSEQEVNRKWVGSGMRGIYKRRAAPCAFLPMNSSFLIIWNQWRTSEIQRFFGEQFGREAEGEGGLLKRVWLAFKYCKYVKKFVNWTIFWQLLPSRLCYSRKVYTYDF